MTGPLEEMLEANQRGEGRTVAEVVTIGPPLMMRAVSDLTRPYGVPCVASLNSIMVDATGMCGACMVPVIIDGKMVRKHACIDGPEIDSHLIDWDKFLPRFGQFRTQEQRSRIAHGLLTCSTTARAAPVGERPSPLWWRPQARTGQDGRGGAPMAEVELSTQHGGLPAYLSTPSAEPPWPGVVVLHDAFGMTSDIRRQADWLAGEGYQALVPDLMAWGGRARCLWSLFGSLRRRTGRVFDEIEAGRAWLAGHPHGTGRVGVLGFCLGGGFALVVVPGGAFDVASVNYGTAAGRPDAYGPEFLAGACPVVGSYGAQDPLLRGAAGRLAASLDQAGVRHDVVEYQGARHGFMNDHEAREVPGVMRLTMHAMGSAYRPEPAADARRRIVDFFAEHL